MTVRDRILATVVVLSALALVVAGGTAWYFQRERVDADIEAALERTIDELRALAETGVDPDTGDTFQTSDRLLYTMMRREVPATNEGMIAFVEDNLRYRTQDVGVPLALDPEFVQLVSGTWEAEEVAIATHRTSQREYRYAAIPVRVGDSPPGALILAFDRDAEQARVSTTFHTYGLVAAVALVLLTVVSWALSRRLLRPLRTLRETAAQISETDLSRRIPVTGEDDISDLARTFNDMLARLETSFGAQRQLLDDAGHELRTPITIVRGHLELMDPADPEDSASTRALALRELDRMHRLADDLVLLAKAETPDFINAAPTELGALVDNVLDLARPLGDRRWRITDRAEVVAVLDEQRVIQALLQLAANAVKFSEDGTTISLGSALSGDDVLLWVVDEGIGIAPEDQSRIFERFAQTRGSRSRAGSGLGLSIVAAIAAGHGGSITVDSRPGHGARFTLRLPSPGADSPEPEADEIIVEPDEPDRPRNGVR